MFSHLSNSLYIHVYTLLVFLRGEVPAKHRQQALRLRPGDLGFLGTTITTKALFDQKYQPGPEELSGKILLCSFTKKK